MSDFLATLERRVLLLDGAMGTADPGPRAVDRGRLLGPGELLGDPQPVAPRPRARDPPGLPRGRRGCARDQQLRRLAGHARRVRARRPGVRDQPPRRRARRRGDRELCGRRPPALRDRRDRPRHPPAVPRPHRLPHARARLRGPGLRPARRRRGRDPLRDLPGPAAGQGRGQRRPRRDARGRPRRCR